LSRAALAFIEIAVKSKQAPATVNTPQTVR